MGELRNARPPGRVPGRTGNSAGGGPGSHGLGGGEDSQGASAASLGAGRMQNPGPARLQTGAGAGSQRPQQGGCAELTPANEG